MKITVAAVASIDARRIIYQHEVAKIAIPIAGKKVEIEIDPSANVCDLVSIATEKFAFDPSLGICRQYLVQEESPIDPSTSISELNLTENSVVQVRFVVEVL
jgi:hypothetical protein